ncbi:calcium-binding and coiled-coil domain-containing 2-like protein [Labeo rohita]|uniref:Calcium-binding and coiled-coil domain-containing 2-like protein n=1 Tax=Labeo rohita TaxID=84645 RepID=A0A498LCL9_LABRO|nr:calcium-binding and coiled-coil domain-containing 2-like protein [Labeo rohita]RXN11187.1 calcium-binding and coiled-coil domain-containing 2-like protein [Labeo rohita]
MRDRTKELGNTADASEEDEETVALMIKPGSGSSANEEKENEAFFKKVQEIREGLETIKRKVSELENKQKTVLGVALPEDSMKKELQSLREDIKGMASQIQKKLKSIEPKKTEGEDKYIPVNVRMRRTQILNDAKATRQALNEIESRHDEIIKLEKSIKELHDMFQYLAMEVEAQGEMVDRIEESIKNSHNYVEKAVAETASAVETSKKVRKVTVSLINSGMNDGTEEETVPVIMETSSFSQVVFNDVPPSYPPNIAVTCRYTLTGALQPSSRDWIGIYKVGWNSTQKYYTYVWVDPPLGHVGPEPLVQQVVFKEGYLPKDDGEFYQFCYVDSFGHVKGASTPFCFQNPAETSLGSSLEKDLLVITTQAEKLEKEKEDFVKEIEALKEANAYLKSELDEKLHEIHRLRSSMEDMNPKDKPESPLPDVQSYTSTEEPLTCLQEKYQRAVQKIQLLKKERTELQQELGLKDEEILGLNTLLKEAEQNYNKVQDQVKLLQVDVQSSRKDYEKLHAEIQELRMKRALEDRRAENKSLQTSILEQEAQRKEENKVQIQALLAQLAEARGLLRSEVQSCKDASKRAETAEQELKEVKRKLEEMALKQAEDENTNQVQTRVCQHCHEGFPGVTEDELAEHEQSHKVCPLCTLICDDMGQQEFEDHVYSHEI